jgi:mannose-6-phosphate isomerase
MEYLYKDERPWGEYYVLKDEKNFKVKIIKVNPGQRLSLQYHQKRSESWTIVEGSGIMTLGSKNFEINYGDTVKINKKEKHRVTNNGNSELVFIEVQTGDYFGEDDIIRMEDDYNRK